MHNPWIAYYRPRPAARLRLFCFHHAGGGPGVFRTWPDDLPADIEVCPVLLPGREARRGEPCETNLDRLADRLVQALWPLLDRPFALFGHSLGAVLSFELARRLQRERRGPAHLFVAARRAPHLAVRGPALHTLSDDQFVNEIVRRFNGIPPVVLAEPELLQWFLPVLRADFALLESFRYQAAEPLSCPMTALGGLEDQDVARADLQAWGELTHGPFALHTFPGGHFFVQTERDSVLRTVAAQLSAAASPGG